MPRPGLQPNSSWRALSLPSEWPPTLVVVVDTEEEFDWNAPFNSSSCSTRNILVQPLVQEIMDRHGIVPIYVVDYPVADTPEAVSVLRAIADNGRCEIGAHLHPWVCPPHQELINAHNSFPGNLPPALEREKLVRLTALIEGAFGRRPTIYKAGRYGLGPATFATLMDLGYRVDASVVPHTDFSDASGPDFTGFPAGPFAPGDGLVELPLSVHFAGALAPSGPSIYPCLTRGAAKGVRAAGIAARLGLIERLRLTPEGQSLADMKRQTRAALARGERYFMLTYHSSTLLPGATCYVRNDAERAAFLERLAGYFQFFMGECAGQTRSLSAVSDGLQSSAKDENAHKQEEIRCSVVNR